jgi:hypothetical protein
VGSGIEARLECRNNQIKGKADIDSVVELSEYTGASDGSVECLWVLRICGVRRASLVFVLWAMSSP